MKETCETDEDDPKCKCKVLNGNHCLWTLFEFRFDMKLLNLQIF